MKKIIYYADTLQYFPVLTCFVNVHREMSSEPNFTTQSEKVLFLGRFQTDRDSLGKRIVLMHVEECGCTPEDKLILIAEFLNSLYYADGNSEEVKIECTSIVFEEELIDKLWGNKIMS